MAFCKYCDDEIEWRQKPDGKWQPINDDGTAHNCRARRPQYDPYRELFLHKQAPDEVVRAAYRALAQLNHPDRGGSNERMKAINAAYESIMGGKA